MDFSTPTEDIGWITGDAVSMETVDEDSPSVGRDGWLLGTGSLSKDEEDSTIEDGSLMSGDSGPAIGTVMGDSDSAACVVSSEGEEDDVAIDKVLIGVSDDDVAIEVVPDVYSEVAICIEDMVVSGTVRSWHI
jgi:hypothetical protein